MEWYWIVLITLVVVWSVSIVLAQFDEDYTLYWACGLLYPILMVLFYPVRAWNTYENSKNYYEHNGISRLQYIFGKRVKR